MDLEEIRTRFLGEGLPVPPKCHRLQEFELGYKLDIKEVIEECFFYNYTKIRKSILDRLETSFRNFYAPAKPSDVISKDELHSMVAKVDIF